MMRVFILLALIGFLINCTDKETVTQFVLRSKMDVAVNVFMGYKESSVANEVFILEPDEQKILENLNILGRKEYREISEFLDQFDSMVCVQNDSIISRSLINPGRWVFEESSAYEGNYIYTIDTLDFNEN